MTRMSYSAGRIAFWLFVSLSLSACAQQGKGKDQNQTDTPKQTQPGQPPASTPPANSQPVDLPKLTEQQKSQVLEVFTGIARMDNSLTQLYTPDKDAQLDSVEQYILKTLQSYCKVAHNNSKNGNATEDDYSLSGDACPAKNTRIERGSVENGPSYVKLGSALLDNYDLLTPELTQVLPQVSVGANDTSSIRMAMPAKNVLQRILSENGSKLVKTKDYGDIKIGMSLDLTLLNLVSELPNGDLLLGDFLDVQGSGQNYRMEFSNFTAELKIVFSRRDSKLYQEAYLNGELISQAENTAAQRMKAAIPQAALSLALSQ